MDVKKPKSLLDKIHRYETALENSGCSLLDCDVCDKTYVVTECDASLSCCNCEHSACENCVKNIPDKEKEVTCWKCKGWICGTCMENHKTQIIHGPIGGQIQLCKTCQHEMLSN